MAYIKRYKKRSLFDSWSLTMILILVNVIIFFISLIVVAVNPDFINFLALQSSNVFAGKYVWTIFTSMFMHAGFFHLFVNMFTLFFLGSLVERIIGRKRYIWFYLISGIFASLFFVGLAFVGQFIPRGDFLFGGFDDFAVGASGALFGLVGLLAVLIPKKKVYLIAGPLIVIILQSVIGVFVSGSLIGVIDTISTIVIFLMLFSLFSGMRGANRFAVPVELPFWLTPIVAIVPLFVVAFFVKLPIGNSAHLGGLIVGLLYGLYLRRNYGRKIKMLNKVLR